MKPPAFITPAPKRIGAMDGPIRVKLEIKRQPHPEAVDEPAAIGTWN